MVLLSLSLVIVVVLYIHDLVQLLLSLFFILVMLPFVANKDEYIKMAEPIEMPFWLWTRVGPRNYVSDVGAYPHANEQF